MNTMKKPLTKRQSDVLTFIKSCILNDSLPPTIQDICHKFGFASTNGVSEILKALEAKGHIRRKSKGAGRGILLIGSQEENSILNKNENTKDVNIKYLSIIGEGNAENPMSIFINSKGQIAIDNRFIETNGITFAFKVNDNGMDKIGISKGDIAILKQISLDNVKNGLVLAIVNDQTMLRELNLNLENYELRAYEKGYPKIRFTKNEESIAIVGKVIGLIKRFE